MEFVDLRSDTVTRPAAGMLEAMATAQVGDDVFGEDAEAIALQEEVAALLGQEAALFVPSGTMANEVAIRTHTEPGDEIVVELKSHIFAHEGGGPAALSGVCIRTLQARRGILDPADVEAAIRNAPDGGHQPYTKLICLENPSNEGGGSVYPLEVLDAHLALAKQRGIRTHLDGARMWNAVMALGVDGADFTAPFDTVSLCLSKGLGAPVGSLVAGDEAFRERALLVRKRLGGWMRQAGHLAAAGRIALERNVERLAEDHALALDLARRLGALEGLSVDLERVQTNIANVVVESAEHDAASLSAALDERGVAVFPMGERVLRFVTHLDGGPEEVERLEGAAREILGG